jgi:hypothetical protein
MKKYRFNRFICIAAGGLCGLGFFATAIAAASLNRAAPVPSTIDSKLSTRVALPSPVLPSAPAILTPLDLRLLRDPPAPDTHAGTAALAFGAFPLGIHQPAYGPVELSYNDHGAQSGFTISEADFRVASPAQGFLRRMHREGLPIARLWETKSALLSIGLNQRGKPGVWFSKSIR